MAQRADVMPALRFTFNYYSDDAHDILGVYEHYYSPYERPSMPVLFRDKHSLQFS